MKKDTGYITNALFYLSLAAGSFSLLKISSSFIRSSTEAEEFVSENIEDIMRIQESHFGFSPFSPPDISFSYVLPSSSFFWNNHAEYRQGKIYFSSRFCSFAIPGHPTRNRLATFICMGKPPALDYVIAHELGHYYTDQLSVDHGIPPFPTESTPENRNYIGGLLMVHEGIAEYFAMVGVSEPDGFEEFVRYSEAYHLVAPLINQYGVEGILAMIRDPPQGQEVYQLPRWREETFGQLVQLRK